MYDLEDEKWVFNLRSGYLSGSPYFAPTAPFHYNYGPLKPPECHDQQKYAIQKGWLIFSIGFATKRYALFNVHFMMMLRAQHMLMQIATTKNIWPYAQNILMYKLIQSMPDFNGALQICVDGSKPDTAEIEVIKTFS